MQTPQRKPVISATAPAAAEAYNAAPYASFPHGPTHPALLHSVARLFGLKAPGPSHARILEVGCASGANILAIAAHYPHSVCVGIDYARNQIEEAKIHARALGLSNLRLETAAIEDIDATWGKFDYIIAHGILSWVPPDVQESLFRLCRSCLSENGVAYISYNFEAHMCSPGVV
jgi:cyclopropane fatty-acyl-phospholipid synthase-like methyltransferase